MELMPSVFDERHSQIDTGNTVLVPSDSDLRRFQTDTVGVVLVPFHRAHINGTSQPPLPHYGG
jgi:hypothetical protein